MPLIELRLRFGEKNPQDLLVNISDKTHTHLMNSSQESIRVSTYLDRDWKRVEANYEELYVSQDCPARFRVTRLTPGSRTRWTVTLPDEMKEGEQITVQVTREPA